MLIVSKKEYMIIMRAIAAIVCEKELSLLERNLILLAAHIAGEKINHRNDFNPSEYDWEEPDEADEYDNQ